MDEAFGFRVRRYLGANPHWPVMFVALAIWGYYLSSLVFPEGAHHHHAAPSVFGFLAGWMVMVYAMMLPMMSKTIRFLRETTPRYRFGRTLVVCVLGYSTVWLVVGGALFPLASSDDITSMTVAGVLPLSSLAFLAAACFNESRWRAAAVYACGTGIAPRINGWGADWDVLRLGLYEGRKCLLSCGHVMLAMATAAHSLWLMAVLTGALIYERARLPKKTRVVTFSCVLAAVLYLLP